MEYSFKKMTDVLNANGFKFSKKFGQNFIVDENIINNIINKSMIDKDTLVDRIGTDYGKSYIFAGEYDEYGKVRDMQVAMP